MSKLIDSGGYGCIYYPGIDCNGKLIEEPMVSKIIDNYAAQHELTIAKMVKKIKNYKDHFLPIENYCNVEGKLPVKKCKILTRFYKFKILYVPFKQKLKNNFAFKPLYHTLLKSVQILVQHNLIHFDIKRENIIIADKVYLLDFGISFSMQNIFKHLLHAFYTYHIKYFQWPLEVHILSYFLNKGPLTNSSIKMICTEFVKYNVIFDNSSIEFQDEYTKKSIEYYSKLLTLSPRNIVKSCLQGWKTWDNYALMIYLYEEGYAKDITPFFMKVIHYLPKERPSIEECLAATSTATATGSSTSTASTATGSSA